MTKRDLYTDYNESYLTGIQLKHLFANSYLCYGKHHQQIAQHPMNFEKDYRKIVDETLYRVFLSPLFCGIFDAKTDKKLYFFGYTKN